MKLAENVPHLSPLRFGQLCGEIDRPFSDRDAVLIAAGLTATQWVGIKAALSERLKQADATRDLVALTAFREGYANGKRGVALAAEASQDAAPQAPPAAMQPTATAAAPLLEVPSYLRERTGGMASDPVVGPSASPAIEPPASRMHETELLPSLDQLAAMFGPKPSPLPFSGEASPEQLRELLRPLDPEVPDQAGLTEALPTPEELARIVASAQPFAKSREDASSPTRMDLERYAAFRAALVVHGESHEPTQRRFDVRNPAEKEALQAAYFRRFKEEPGVRDRFEALLLAEIARARAAK